MLGDWVVFVGPAPAYALKATPIGKNEWRTVLDRSSGQSPVSGGPTGTAVVAGGTDARRWAVERLVATPEGPPAAEALDRFGGGVAWFDASGAVQVAFSQVSTSPLGTTAARVEDPDFRTSSPFWAP